MTTKNYFIPVDSAQTELIILRSRFISTAAYTPTVEAAKTFIAEMNQTYSDASHNVYAFAVGYGASVTHGMSDAGEPKGTAGRPTLAVVKGCGLGDVTVVTTRYFGGTKLGTGGLVKAYTESAQLVLAEIPRVEKIEKVDQVFSMPYNLYEPVKRLLGEYEGEILDQEFGVEVTLAISLPETQFPDLAEALTELSAGQIQLTQD